MIRRHSAASKVFGRCFNKSYPLPAIHLCNFSSSTPPPTKSAPTTPATTADNTNSSKLDQWLEAWNEHSGTHEISKLKELVHNSSLKFDRQQRLVADARRSVDHALSAWEDSQIQHAQLMQVRDRWTPSQALEFAKLLEREVQVRSDLEMAKKDLAEKEMDQSKLQIEYMNNLRKRYHEEQIWTDKWRILSTYGTWGLIALNSVVFLISQYLFRLRERSRMKDFETLLKETLSSNTDTMLAIREHQNDIVEQRNNESRSGDDVVLRQSEGGQANGQPIIVGKDEGEMKASSEQQHGARADAEQQLIEDNASGEQKPGDSSLESESKREDSQSQNKQQPVLLTSIKSKLAKLDRDEKMTNALRQASHSLVSYWSSIQNRAAAARIDGADKIDVPSAAVGAFVASVAWLVAMSLPRKGGQ